MARAAVAEPALRECVSGKDPESVYDLMPGIGEFWEAPDLEDLAEKLIAAKLPDFPECEVRYLWKGKGSRTNGKAVFGKTLKTSGLTGYFGHSDYVIWLAADFVGDTPFSNFQVEALLYHELLHVSVEEDENGNRKLGVRAHDFEGFREEIEEYGFWDSDTRAIARTIQGRLELEDPGEAIESIFAKAGAAISEGLHRIPTDADVDEDSLPELDE